jgi:hypothetical protein
MSKLDDMFLEAIADWETQGRPAEQVHGVKNFFSGRGSRLPEQIKDLVLSLMEGCDDYVGDLEGEEMRVFDEEAFRQKVKDL